MTRTPVIAVSLFAVFALALVVLAAISANALGLLLIGVGLLSLLALGLLHFAIKMFDAFTIAVNKRDDQRQQYHLAALRLGFQPMGAHYELLPAPLQEAEDIPVSVAGVSPQELGEYRTDAQNLVALSNQLIRDGIVKRNDQIAPYHSARKSDYFRDVMVWTHAIQYLLVNQMAKPVDEGKRHKGTFCIAGTVAQLWERLKD